jgi:hypothetical protein
MKNKATILAILALLGASFVITGCPRHHRPHVPHPHRLPHPHHLIPADSMLQIDGRNNTELAVRAAEKPAAPV